MPAGSAPNSGEETKPRRIVSLDLCTDQLAGGAGGPQAHRRRDPSAADPAVSAIPEKARGMPITHGGAEDVLRYDPDLVLAGPFGVSATVRPAAPARPQRGGRAAAAGPRRRARVRARGGCRRRRARQGRGADRRFRPPPVRAWRRPPARPDGRHLSDRRHGLGSRQPGRRGAGRRRIPQHVGRLSAHARRPGAAGIAGRPAAGPAGAGEQCRGVPHGAGRQPAPSRHSAAARSAAPPSSCPGAIGCAARRTSSTRSSSWPRREPASRRAGDDARLRPAGRQADAPARGLGAGRGRGVRSVALGRPERPRHRRHRRGPRADLQRDPPAARRAGRAGGRRARAVRRRAAGLSAQSAGGAEPGRRLGRRGAGRGAGDPPGPVAGVRAGAAARRARGRRRRHAGRGGAGGRARRTGDADPRRPRRVEHRHGAGLAGPQSVAEPVRRGRDGVLDDGLAGRPQPDAAVDQRAAHPGRHGAAADRGARARRPDAGRGCGRQPRHRSWPHAACRDRRHGA